MTTLEEAPTGAGDWSRRLAVVIAVAFLSGEREAVGMAHRAAAAIGARRDDWLPSLAREMVEVFPATPDDDLGALVTLILRCDSFTYAIRADGSDDGPAFTAAAVLAAPTEVPPAAWIATNRSSSAAAAVGPYEVAAVTGSARLGSLRASGVAPTIVFDVPPIPTLGDLGDYFGLHWTQLAWYADVRSFERDTPDGPLRHYTYRWWPKARGGARLIEAPKPMLRFFQRRISGEILEPIPAHPAAHGFRRGRSVHTFAGPHVGQDVVIRVDLESFFASVRAGRVFGILRRASYPHDVAHALTGFVTNVAPSSVLSHAPRQPTAIVEAHRRSLVHLSQPHLPQGAPTSPALANLAAFGLDRRLDGLARSFDARYTRYADDLAFSGGHRLGRQGSTHRAHRGHRHGRGLPPQRTENPGDAPGATPDPRRPRRERPGAHPRHDFDRLKAILHDAATNGPGAANRNGHPDFRAHLLGRIGWVDAGSPTRGAKLRAAFDRIDWMTPDTAPRHR